VIRAPDFEIQYQYLVPLHVTQLAVCDNSVLRQSTGPHQAFNVLIHAIAMSVSQLVNSRPYYNTSYHRPDGVAQARTNDDNSESYPRKGIE
jgi:hypothetical protein